MNPKISIIVPVYNAEKFLNKCIKSILNQTFTNFELILINDGSLDNSGEICNKFLHSDNRVKVIHKENYGQATARNSGLQVAQGEYVGFVDSDDWIEVDMYKNLYESSIKENADISIIGLREVNEFGAGLSEYSPKIITFSEILKRAYPCNKLFKKQLFTNNDLSFIDGRYYEDLELIPKLFVKSKKVICISKVSYNYLKRSESTTGVRDEKILDNLWAYTQIKNYLIEENIYMTYKEEFEKGVSYFRKFYINILYDYPTAFLLKNFKRIKSDFDKIGGLNFEDILDLLRKHLIFLYRKKGSNLKNKLGSIIK